MRKLVLLVVVVAVAGMSTAIGIASAGGPHATASRAAKLQLRSGKLGKFIVDGRGKTLYLFEKDRNGRSACSGACAHNWPPLLTSGKPSVGRGLSASKAGTTRRSDGKLQATYGGHPLYHFVGDHNRAGPTNGQGLKAFGAAWYVVGANGKKIDKS